MNQYNHQSTYSMQAILNHNLAPQICKKILDQIKSPLMEQSFILTTDDQWNTSTSRYAKRPNLPPPTKNISPKVRPHIKKQFQTSGYFQNPNIKNNNNNRSQTYSDFSYQYNQSSVHNKNGGQSNILGALDANNSQLTKGIVEYVLSPLDPTITQKKYQQKGGLDGDNLCGSLFDNQEERDNELQYDFQPKVSNFKFKRRKIFDQPRRALSVGEISSFQRQVVKSQLFVQNKIISLAQAIRKLNELKQFQLCSFLNLVKQISLQLRQINSYKAVLNQNFDVVYQLYAKSPDTILSFQLSQGNRKVLNRLKVGSLSQMIGKISNLNKRTTFTESHQKQNICVSTVQKLLISLTKIQQTLSNYSKKANVIPDLKKIYMLIQETFQYNPKSFRDQLIQILHQLKVYQLDEEFDLFQYIWPFSTINKINQEEFVNGIVCNDLVYRCGPVQGSSQIKNRRQNCQQQEDIQLQQMGFKRNY